MTESEHKTNSTLDGTNSKGNLSEGYPKDFRPILSAAIKSDKDFRKLQCWPYIVSPKLDGIRVFIHPTLGAVTRSMKPIRNKRLQRAFLQLLEHVPEFAGCDCEIVFGTPTLASMCSPSVFQDTTSAVMSFDGPTSVTLHIFDRWSPLAPDAAYGERLNVLNDILERHLYPFLSEQDDVDLSLAPVELPEDLHIVALESNPVHTLEALLAYETECLRCGFEGIMIRDPDKPYKFGRSSLSKQQQHLIKLKRTADAEAEIIGFEELEHNDNTPTQDAFGLTERSSAKANKTAGNTLGAFIVKGTTSPYEDVSFKIGTGFNQSQRKIYWDDKDYYLGRIVTYKYQAQGAKDAPRFPVFLRFRGDE